MSVEVRAALEVDLDALIQLNHVVQSLHAVLYPGDFTQMVDPCAVRSFFAARLAGPKSAIGIAEADRVPVGYVWFEVQARPETPFTPPRHRIYVHHIAVAPEARRRGIATALMHYVEHQAASEASTKLLWTPGQLILTPSTSLARKGSPRSTWCCERRSPAESAEGRLRPFAGSPMNDCVGGMLPVRFRASILNFGHSLRGHSGRNQTGRFRVKARKAATPFDSIVVWSLVRCARPRSACACCRCRRP